MIIATKNVKDGEFLLTVDEAVKYNSEFITDADADDLSKPMKLVKVMEAIEHNHVHAVAYDGSKANPLYRCQDVKVDPKAVLNGK